jgi:hypothetical protein
VNAEAEQQWAGEHDRQTGIVKEGTIGGDVKAEPSRDAYVKLTNVPKKEAAERKRWCSPFFRLYPTLVYRERGGSRKGQGRG